MRSGEDTGSDASVRKHVVISGTGRAGTTFLVALLTNLGLDTGFQSGAFTLDENARAGLEYDVRDEQAPYIVKSPFFCDYAAEVLNTGDVRIDHLFLPLRDLHAAAESRRYVRRSAILKSGFRRRLQSWFKPVWVDGGLWHTDRQYEQEQILLRQVYKLLLAVSETDVPVTLLRYPRLVKDSAYLYRKLSPLVETIAYERFLSVFEQTVRPDWMHSFNQNDH